MNKLIPFLSSLALLSTVTASYAGGIERFQVSEDIGYSEVVRAGDYVYISGNVGWGEMPDAVRTTYGSLGKLLAAQGLSFKDVVKENVYTTNLDALKGCYSIRNSYYEGVYPAATWVQVERLFQPEFVLEVELVAFAPHCPAKDADTQN